MVMVKNNNMPRIRTDIQFDQSLCKGCGYCKEICERGVYAMRETDRTVSRVESYVANPRQCVGCGYCELICPDQVMAVIGSWGLNIPRGEVSHGKGSKQ